MKRVFSIGEALIDFIPNVTECELKDKETVTKQIGGAPCNVAFVQFKSWSNKRISLRGKQVMIHWR